MMYQIYRKSDNELISDKFPMLEDAIAEVQQLYNDDCIERDEFADDYDVVQATDLKIIFTTALDNYFITK